MTSILTKKNLKNILRGYLPPEQAVYKNSFFYRNVTDAMFDFLTASQEEREEKKQALVETKKAFEGFCVMQKYFDQKLLGKSETGAFKNRQRHYLSIRKSEAA